MKTGLVLLSTSRTGKQYCSYQASHSPVKVNPEVIFQNFKRKLHHEEKSWWKFSFAITIRRVRTFYTHKKATTDIYTLSYTTAVPAEHCILVQQS